VPHHRRFSHFARTRAFIDAQHAAPPQIADAVAELLTRLERGQAKDLEVLPYKGDPQLGNAWTMAVPGCDAFILYKEYLDQAVLQLIQLFWLDEPT
jgi:hypothetical protein